MEIPKLPAWKCLDVKIAARAKAHNKAIAQVEKQESDAQQAIIEALEDESKTYDDLLALKAIKAKAGFDSYRKIAEQVRGKLQPLLVEILERAKDAQDAAQAQYQAKFAEGERALEAAGLGVQDRMENNRHLTPQAARNQVDHQVNMIPKVRQSKEAWTSADREVAAVQDYTRRLGLWMVATEENRKTEAAGILGLPKQPKQPKQVVH